MEFISTYLEMGLNGLTDFVIPFIIVLSVLVFVHEWGHYIVARMCKVHVEQFSIGFGKELFGWTDKNNTRWKVSLIPLGGYVQMFGDTDPASSKSTDEVKGDGEVSRPMTSEEKKVAFFGKPVWQRAAIVFAGPAINFIFALFLLAGLYTTAGKPVTPPVAAAVMIDGAGYEAGIKPHDRITAIDGKEVQSFTDIQKQVAVSLNRPLELDVLRGNETLKITVTPKIEEMEDRFGFTQSRGLIGIMSTDKGIDINGVQSINGSDISSLSIDQKRARVEKIIGKVAEIGLPSGDGVSNVLVDITKIDENDNSTLFLTQISGQEIVPFTPTQAVVEATREIGFIISGTLEALGQIISGTRSATELGGIVRIGAIAGDAAQSGLIAIITFTALLSVNLGLINLFPIPLLDGGHLVFYAYEAVFKKPMPEMVMEYALKMGMVLLVSLMLFANLNDIVQIIL